PGSAINLPSNCLEPGSAINLPSNCLGECGTDEKTCNRAWKCNKSTVELLR
ncbi:hypothetical protein G4B88_024576, partial [Cannabis sativa]